MAVEIVVQPRPVSLVFGKELQYTMLEPNDLSSQLRSVVYLAGVDERLPRRQWGRRCLPLDPHWMSAVRTTLREVSQTRYPASVQGAHCQTDFQYQILQKQQNLLSLNSCLNYVDNYWNFVYEVSLKIRLLTNLAFASLKECRLGNSCGCFKRPGLKILENIEISRRRQENEYVSMHFHTEDRIAEIIS